MHTVAIIVAAGAGRRMGNRPKPLLELNGRPMLCYSLEAFQASRRVDGIVVAVPPGMLAGFRDRILSCGRYPKIAAWVEGGARRQDSVAAALAVVPAEARLVAVHDAARPCVRGELIGRLIEAAQQTGAAVPGIEVVDTIKEIDEAGMVARSLRRERLRAVQTPQVFSAGLLRGAYRLAAEGGVAGTDDASLVERAGHPVAVVEGEEDNFKVTVPQDLGRAETILKRRGAGGGESAPPRRRG
ncbi:MAG: 2-C-methyl-D-erythritol 4-phosphate cytidylyltransferase [Chlamydiae bacterium]|nr:2-C-methyl-D-erythritol 4-phosphate cytidylyltransferase [Chlamydiota bacterium]HQM53194.1 2-C-methyl-D-erythritol 4-phosphate cytidylyltransferase [bacterium]